MSRGYAGTIAETAHSVSTGDTVMAERPMGDESAVGRSLRPPPNRRST